MRCDGCPNLIVTTGGPWCAASRTPCLTLRACPDARTSASRIPVDGSGFREIAERCARRAHENDLNPLSAEIARKSTIEEV